MRISSHSKPRQMEIAYGERHIRFSLFKAERKTIEIAVLPTLEVEVKVPLHAQDEEVKARVKKRARWILKQQRLFEVFLPKQPPKKYISGETLMYLGKPLRLKVLIGEKGIKKKNRQLRVSFPESSSRERIKATVESWFDSEARRILQVRFEKLIQQKTLGKGSNATLAILKMKKRWGSCTPQGKIILNPELIHAPAHCIDYVIVHEYCHLTHPRHDKAFYAQLTKLMPDWRKRQERLNRSL